MGTDSDRIPRETPVEGTNKIAMSRIEVADLFCPTTQMAPLFADGATDESLIIEEHVPMFSGEHQVLVSRDSLQVPIFDLRASGLVPIEDRATAPVEAIEKPEQTAPLVLSRDDVVTMNAIAAVNDATMNNRSSGTSLGVAPLEPATTVRAPFVVDTPVPRRSPLGPSPTREPWPESSAKLPSAVDNSRERTAMLALDPSSGMPRTGPWQALVAVAKSLRGVRWWLSRRHKTSRVRPIRR
jgi:hypothetical protein